MGATSINIQPCKISSSEQHNERTKALDYVRSELSHLNEHWQSDNKSLSQHLEEVQRSYQYAKGKKMHAKATPIREGVIVIDKTTTMQDLHLFGNVCEERWGIKPLQIHIHRDEGYMHAKEWTPNLHAHIVWRWTDEQGVTRKLGRHDMVEMQTLLAETLGMARGVSSDKKHLNSIQYKVEAEQKRLSELQAKSADLRLEIGDAKTIKDEIEEAREAKISPIEELIISNTTKKLFGGKKTDYEAVVRSIKEQAKQRAIIDVSEKSKEKIEIRNLKSELGLVKEELSKQRERADKSEEREDKLCEFLSRHFGERFERFKAEVHQYWHKYVTLTKCVYMWLGQTLSDSIGNKYSADQDRGRLLINGKTWEEQTTRSKGLER